MGSFLALIIKLERKGGFSFARDDRLIWKQ